MNHLAMSLIGLLPGMGIAEARTAFNALPVQMSIRRRMLEPWRHYHVQRHLDHMFMELETAESEGVVIHDGTAVVGAVTWHDSVMDPMAAKGRNETLSAMLCKEEMGLRVNRHSTQDACTGILSTITHHLPLDCGQFRDAGIFLDVDLAILGAEEDAFASYDRDIAKEYAHVARDVYRSARAGVLSTFRDRPRIYFTEWAQDRFETKARSNLEKAIRRLLA
jgi:predicted metal-dependent HD superfamily phosphohydrolase